MRFRLAAAALLVLAAPLWSGAPRSRALAQEGESDKKMQYYQFLLDDYCSGICKNKECCSVVAF